MLSPSAANLDQLGPMNVTNYSMLLDLLNTAQDLSSDGFESECGHVRSQVGARQQGGRQQSALPYESSISCKTL